jgi:catechol 2,3-dioxygenase-like lactoylglutathione lyase family enzyme
MLASEKIVGFVPISDPARAKSFYGEILGLKFVSEDPFAVVFDANGNTLRLTRVQDARPQPFTILGWQVSDIVTTVQQLQAAGVAFERYGDFMKQDELGIWTAPGGSRIAWFKDPDGNILSIGQH